MANIAVETVQDFLAAIDKCGFHAETMEEIGEFDRDIATARDDNCLWQFIQMKSLVRADAELMAGQSRARVRPTTGGDQNMFSSNASSISLQLDRMFIDEHGATCKNLDLRIFKPLAVEPFQTVDFLVLGSDQLLPVKAAFAHPPAVTGGVLEM